MPEVKNVPTYLSVKKLDKVFKKIEGKSLKTIPATYFQPDFSKSDSHLAVAALRFLGLVDAQYNSTTLMKSMGLNGAEKEKAMAEMVREAYRELFEVVPQAHNMSKEELNNDFIQTYGISVRIASGAIPAFIYLCEYAGLREKREDSKRSQGAEKQAKFVRRAPQQERSRFVDTFHPKGDQTVIPFGNCGIQLIIPIGVLTNPDLFEEYKLVATSLKNFSDKYRGTLNTEPDVNGAAD